MFNIKFVTEEFKALKEIILLMSLEIEYKHNNCFILCHSLQIYIFFKLLSYRNSITVHRLNCEFIFIGDGSRVFFFRKIACNIKNRTCKRKWG